MNIDFESLIYTAWAQIWQVTLVVLIVAMLVRLFCRHRPHLAYMLWILVVVKSLTPPFWSSPTGVFSQTNIRMVTAPSMLFSENKQWTVESEPVTSRQIVGERTGKLKPQTISQESNTPERNSAAIVARSDSVWKQITWPLVPGIVWLTGVAVCATVVIGKWVLCWSALLRFSVPANDTLSAQLDGLRHRLDVNRKVRLLVTSRPIGPAACGIIRPTILLPDTLLSLKSADVLEPILAHELTHIRRNDPLMGMLQILTQIVWWFHPLIWWVNREITRERERCCDEQVVSGLACNPEIYAQSLLDVLKQRRRMRPLFAQPGIRALEITTLRLEHIMNSHIPFQRRTPWSYWFVLIAGIPLLIPGAELTLTASTPEQKSSSEFVILVDEATGAPLDIRQRQDDASKSKTLAATKTEADDKKSKRKIEGIFGSSLPPDGSWVRFKWEFPLHQSTVTALGTLTIRSVGRANETGEPCRWIEIDLERKNPNEPEKAGYHSITGILIPDKFFDKREFNLHHLIVRAFQMNFHPSNGKRLAFNLELGGEDDRPLRLWRRTPPLEFVYFPAAKPDELHSIANTKTVEYKRGKLDCEGVNGKSVFDSVLTFDEQAVKKEVKYQIWRNKKIPFGIAEATLTVSYKLPNVSGIKGNAIQEHFEFTLDDFGTDATPSVSVEARKKKFPEQPKVRPVKDDYKATKANAYKIQ